jgi:hypothetical protein
MEKNKRRTAETDSPPMAQVWWWIVPSVTLMLLPIWVFPFLGLGDYGRHLATSFILKKLLLGDPFYASYFDLNPVIQPYILVQILLAALSFVFGIEVAGRLILTLFIVLLPFSTYVYEKSVGGRPIGWWPLSLCLIYTWHFNMGFLPYLIGLVLALLSIGYFYLHTPIDSFKEAAISGLLLLLCFLSHIIAFGVAGLVLLALNSPYLWKRIRYAGFFLFSLLPSFLLFGNYARDMLSGGRSLGVIEFSSISDAIKNYFIYTFYSYSKLLDCLLGLAILCLFGACLLLNYKSLYLALTGSGHNKDRSLIAAWLLLILLFFIFPFRIGPLFFTNARLTPFILLIGIPLLRMPRKRTAMMLVISLIVIIQVIETFGAYSVINRRYQAVAQTCRSIESQSEFMPIVADNNIDDYHMEPYSYFWVYYLIRNDSVAPCLPAGSANNKATNSPLIYRKLYDKSPGLWPLDRQRAAEIAKEAYYEYILLWKHPEQKETALVNPLREYYRILHESDELILGQRR